jgi:hypothetical protein
LAAIALTGCRPPPTAPAEPVSPLHDNLIITAFVDPDSRCHQFAVDAAREVQAARPARVVVQIEDISPGGRGRHRWQAEGLDCMALMIQGMTTVSWGRGEDRRTVSFLHPPGFSWVPEDLEAAVEAATNEALRAAEPEEAEGVRPLSAEIRSRSIRVGDREQETGQLLIDNEVVLEIGHKRGELAPGQRVAVASRELQEALTCPFTPNQMRVEPTEHGMALLAGERELLTATETDARAGNVRARALAERWRDAICEALVASALRSRPSRGREPAPQTKLAHLGKERMHSSKNVPFSDEAGSMTQGCLWAPAPPDGARS